MALTKHHDKIKQIFVALLTLVVAASTQKPLAGSLCKSQSCANIKLSQYDRSLSNHATGYILHRVQVVKTAEAISISCMNNMYPGENKTTISLGMGNYALTSNRQSNCKQLSGIWYLFSDIGHSQENLFEELCGSWYPAFLMTHIVCDSRTQYHMTHIGGIKHGFLSFQEFYVSFGLYVNWDVLAHGGATFDNDKKSAVCVEFETVLTAGSGYSWLSTPGQAHHNAVMQRFVQNIILNISDRSLIPCQPVLLYSVRKRNYRSILNEEELIDAMKAALPKYRVLAVDISTMTFKEQLILVRKASVFVFPHGGAGPLVLYLRQGASVVELFPFRFADPMYRNLAVMTGKGYLAWQNRNHSAAFYGIGSSKRPRPENEAVHTNSRNTNTVVDISSVLEVIKAAVSVAAASFSTQFLDGFGQSMDADFCGWCTPARHACSNST